ncbi:MAG: methionyl-tRNA formyltransferase [Clostridia bacterium]
MNIVFMGTPDFAVPCLKILYQSGHTIQAVFTQPDKPKGRKQILTPPPVKEMALGLGVRVLQPSTLKDGAAEREIRALNPDLIVVVAYGKILPQAILDIPKYGCINIHGSILPKYRGASPIQSAILCGERTTGVTAMQMDAGMDTGDILLCEETPIGETETAGELFDRLAPMGAAVLEKTVEGLCSGTLTPVKQEEREATYCKMLDKSLSPIDFSRPAAEIHHQILGLSPWPAAKTIIHGKGLKVLRSAMSDCPGGQPGELMQNDGQMVVSCGDGKCVEFLEVCPDGKKQMAASDYLRGAKLEQGLILGRAE